MELSELVNPEKNRKQLENTTDTYSGASTPSYSYDKLNENTDINSKKALKTTSTRKIVSLFSNGWENSPFYTVFQIMCVY